jgi:hypothetical protein
MATPPPFPLTISTTPFPASDSTEHLATFPSHYYQLYPSYPFIYQQEQFDNVGVDPSLLTPGVDREPVDPMGEAAVDQSNVASNESIISACTPRKGKRPSVKTPVKQETQIEKEEQTICLWKSCGQRFMDVTSLGAHVESVHIDGGKQKSYICEWAGCSRQGIAFTKRHKVCNHVRTHTGERPFVCPVPECGKRFSRQDTLAIHTRKHALPHVFSEQDIMNVDAHDDSTSSVAIAAAVVARGGPLKACPVKGCRRMYQNPRSFRKHLASAHGDEGQRVLAGMEQELFADAERYDRARSARNAQNGKKKEAVPAPEGDMNAAYMQQLTNAALTEMLRTDSVSSAFSDSLYEHNASNVSLASSGYTFNSVTNSPRMTPYSLVDRQKSLWMDASHNASSSSLSIRNSPSPQPLTPPLLQNTLMHRRSFPTLSKSRAIRPRPRTNSLLRPSTTVGSPLVASFPGELYVTPMLSGQSTPMEWMCSSPASALGLHMMFPDNQQETMEDFDMVQGTNDEDWERVVDAALLSATSALLNGTEEFYHAG